MRNISYLGKQKRLSQMFINDRTLIAPIDDSLLFGPFVALQDMESTINAIIEYKPNAMLGFKGAYSQYNFRNIPFILNITASTTMGNHVQKTLISSPKEALIMGANCVAFHINYTSIYENEMINLFSRTVSEADVYGMPVCAIAYPRTQTKEGADYNYEDLKKKDLDSYTRLICHVVRSSVELGADIVKTQFTGTTESFKKVIDSAMGIPVVIAGGPLVSVKESYLMAKQAIEAGAAGISYGRNIFNATNIPAYITGIKTIIFENETTENALKIYEEVANVKLG